MAEIEIVAPDRTWPDQFAAIHHALDAGLGDLALRIDHIGSTSVAGLAAKDIIDVQITTNDLGAATVTLTELGYTHKPGLTDLLVGCEDPQQLVKEVFSGRPGDRAANIHVRIAGRRNQRYALLFRDYLRADPVVRDAYGLLKERLAALYPDDVEGYYDIKDPVMDMIYRGAEAWAAATGWDGAAVP